MEFELKNPKPYIIDFVENLLAYVPQKSGPECCAYLYILLAVYTGIPPYVLTRPSTIIRRSVWVNINKPNNQSFSLDVEIPYEFFQLCSDKNIDVLSSLKKKVDGIEITKAISQLSSKNQQKVVLEELPVIFRLMCSESKGMLKEMEARLDMISPNNSVHAFYKKRAQEVFLRRLSLAKIVDLKRKTPD